jgi:hypothetical protein
VGFLVQQLPQLVGTALGQRVADRQRATQTHHVSSAVGTPHASPARVAFPILLKLGNLLFTSGHDVLLLQKLKSADSMIDLLCRAQRSLI